MSRTRLPEDYGRCGGPGVEAFAWGAATPWLESVLREGATLYAWGGARSSERLPGRGPVHVFPAPVAGPDHRARWAVRHYRRGGAAASLLGDRYWGAGRTRPERELETAVRARAGGVPTPAVIAGAVYRAGSSGMAGFYRADLVTELVPNARTLAHVLFERGADLTAALQRAGGLVRVLERAGLLHADLNAGNVVLDAAGETWIIDLDRCRHSNDLDRRVGVAMLRRLERSLRKLSAQHGRQLQEAEREALWGGFEAPP